MNIRSLILVLPVVSTLAFADAPHASLDDKHRVFFKDYCVECHNEKKQKGKLRLDDISFTLDSVENADRWQKILNQINSGEMPPEDAKQPERVAKTEFLDSLSHTLMAARRTLGDSGGMITMRRLNRREYKNTLRDLLGVDINVHELPADGGAGTFDTVGSSLFMSSDQFEQYLALGRQALDEHFARAAVIAPKPSIQHVEAEEWANKQAKQFADMYQEGFDRWKAWQASGGKPPTDFKFSDAGAAEFAKVQFERHWPYFDLYQKLPLVKQGAYLTIYDVTTHVEIAGGSNLPVGDYILRLRVGAVPGTPKSRHVIEVGHRGERKGEFAILSTHEITGTTDQPQILEIPVHLTTTSNRRFAIREKQPLDPHAVFDMWNETRLNNGTGPTPCIWIDWVELEGPANASAPTPVAASTAQPQRMHVEAEATNGRIAKGLQQRVDDHDRYVKWTAGVDAAAQKPENTATAAQIRAEKPDRATHIYSQWQRIKGAPSPKEFGFVDDVNADEQGRRDWVHFVPHHRAYVEHPLTKTGAFLTIDDAFVNSRQAFRIPSDWPAGDYVVRVRIAAMDGIPKDRRFVEFGPQHDSGVCAVASTHEITGTAAAPQVLEIPLKVSPTSSHVYMFRERGSHESDAAASRLFADAKQRNGIGPEFALWIDWIEVENANAPPLAATKTIKERREVESHANAMVGGTYNGYFKGGYTVAKAYLDSDRSKPPSAFGKGIADEQEAKFRVQVFGEHGPTYERYLNDPLTKTGAYLTIHNPHPEEVITLPPDQPSAWMKTKHEAEKAEPGDYMLRFRIGAVKGTPKERHFVDLGTRKDKDDFTLMQTLQISGTTDTPQIIEVPVSIAANGPRTFVLREKRDVKLDFDLYQTARKATGVGPESALWIDWVEWEGPQVKQPPIAKVTHIEPEARGWPQSVRMRLDSETKEHVSFDRWKAAGAVEADLGKFGFRDKPEAEFREFCWQTNHEWFQRYLDRPKASSGVYLDNAISYVDEIDVQLPADAVPGDYIFRVLIGRVSDMPADRAFLQIVEASALDRDARTLLATRQIKSSLDSPEIVEVSFRVEPGGPRTFSFMEKRPLTIPGGDLMNQARAIKEPKRRDPALWIDWIEYEGPLNKSDTKAGVEPVLFANTTNASERDHARAIIGKFAKRAFRDKPPTDEYLNKLTSLFDTRIKAGDKFDVAIKTPLSVVLASPRFLYLSEPAVEKKPRPLTAPEFATRLSYFLWSAPPDDTLLTLARSGDLMKPDVLAHEVDRMIVSEKANEFVSGFVHQWLGMERLDFFQFDTKQFRDFDESAKAAARREVYETFAQLLRANGSARDLLKSDYVIVNGLLATYYGIDGVSGDEFRKVSLPKDSPRGGLLGMAAILAMGSNGERTSPVERGAWVLRKLLHEPPPPAPPNVPQITRLNGQALTTRERLLAHQEQPQCASCHRAIDPIGFGLENFNAAGKWRTEDSFQAVDANGKPNPKLIKTWTIDPAAVFHKGPAFKDYFELRNLIAAKPESFARGLTEALIQYALGRPFGFTDEELATTIVQRSQKEDFALREFVQSLVASKEFHTK